MVLRVALCMACLVGAAAVPPQEATCLRVGEGAVSGRLAGLDDGRVLLEREGAVVALALEDLRRVRLSEPSGQGASPAPWTLWLRGGGRAAVSRIEAGSRPEALTLVGYGWTCTDVALDAVEAAAARRAMRSEAEADSLREALDDPPQHADLLTAGSDGERASVGCVIEGVHADGLRVLLGGSARTVPWSRVLWVVTARDERPAARAHLAELTDGTLLPVEQPELNGDLLSGRLGGGTVAIDRDRLAALHVASERCRYVSSLPVPLAASASSTPRSVA